jgi:hypothetical protein
MLEVFRIFFSHGKMNSRLVAIKYLLWLLAFIFAEVNYMYGQPSHFGGDSRRREHHSPQNKPDDKFDLGSKKGEPLSPIIGRIVWVDSTGKYAVVWLDSAQPLSDRPLGTCDEKLLPKAMLRYANQRTARAIGVIVERGKAAMNQEVIIPSISALTGFQALPEIKTISDTIPDKPTAQEKAPVTEAKPSEPGTSPK